MLYMWGGVFLNIQDINSNIKDLRNLKQGEHANAIMNSIEQQEMMKMNLENDNIYNKINKEIKF